MQKPRDESKAQLTSTHRMAVISIILMLSFTSQLAGCICFQPSVKQVPDTRPGKEGQKVEVREELPWPCKVFWGTIGVLGWFTSRPETREREDEQRKAKYMGEMNRQYQETISRKSLR